ncbi:MAG: Hsp20/alpha crystallin family protein [Planctomycetes bacterium]|nr:Hsp20/alpha crystallin family protein [Planctomycetota bacterium]
MLETPELSQKSRAESSGAEHLRGGPQFVPQVDIYESDKELVLFADLPGVAPADIDLHYERGQLVLQGKVMRPRQEGTAIATEYEYGDFHRVFQLHETIDSTAIEAECNNGVLTVHLPKEQKAQPRKINVRQ